MNICKQIPTLFLFVQLFLFCFCFNHVQARSLHYDYFHVPFAKAKLSYEEHQLLKKIQGWFVLHGRGAPHLDGNLRAVAQKIAKRLSQKPLRSLPHSIVSAAFQMVGGSDQKLRIFSMTFNSITQLSKRLKQTLSDPIYKLGFNKMGFAVHGTKNKVFFLLLVRRGFQVQALPRWYRKNSTITITGKRLVGSSRPYLMLGYHNGKVAKLPFRRKKDGNYSISFQASRTGQLRLQVIVRDHRGSWTSAQWDASILSPKHSWMKISQKARRKAHKIIWQTPRVKKQKHARIPIPHPMKARFAATRLWSKTNEYRKTLGLSFLQRMYQLDDLARKHAQEMVSQDYFGHTSPKTGSFGERFKILKWTVSLTSENIVVAKHSDHALRLLLQSPSHRKNLLEKSFSVMGVGAAIHPSGRLYFVQVFVAVK